MAERFSKLVLPASVLAGLAAVLAIALGTTPAAVLAQTAPVIEVSVDHPLVRSGEQVTVNVSIGEAADTDTFLQVNLQDPQEALFGAPAEQRTVRIPPGATSTALVLATKADPPPDSIPQISIGVGGANLPPGETFTLSVLGSSVLPDFAIVVETETVVLNDTTALVAARDQLLVHLWHDATPAEYEEVLNYIRSQNLEIAAFHRDLSVLQVRIPASASEAQLTQHLNALPGVLTAGPNRIVQATQTAPVVPSDGGYWIEHINLARAWELEDQFSANNSDVAVAVVDDFLDFPQQVAVAHGQDVEGFVRAVSRYSDIIRIQIPGATEGSAADSSLLSALSRGVNSGAKVINLSWGPGSSVFDTAFQKHEALQLFRLNLASAITAAHHSGILVVISSGNEGFKQDTEIFPRVATNDNSPENLLRLQALEDRWHSSVINVGSSTEQNRDAESSVTGPAVDIFAPGERVTYGPGAERINGTSFAAPQVAGAAAVVSNIAPHLTAPQLKDIIIDSADANALAGPTCRGNNIATGRCFFEVPILLTDPLPPLETNLRLNVGAAAMMATTAAVVNRTTLYGRTINSYSGDDDWATAVRDEFADVPFTYRIADFNDILIDNSFNDNILANFQALGVPYSSADNLYGSFVTFNGERASPAGRQYVVALFAGGIPDTLNPLTTIDLDTHSLGLFERAAERHPILASDFHINFAIARDAGRLTFASGRDGDLDLYVGDRYTDPDNLTAGSDAAENYPAWSPDGSRLAFSSDRNGKDHLFILNADGTGLMQLTTGTSDHRFPSWSPDGSQIAFESITGTQNDIFIVDVDNPSAVERLTSDGNSHTPAWSPDGATIAFASQVGGRYGIHFMDVNARVVRSFQHNSIKAELYPAWSPDGTQLAFSRGYISSNADRFDVFIAPVDGSGEVFEVSRFLPRNYHYIHPAWSPDGRHVAFSSTRGAIFVWSEGDALSDIRTWGARQHDIEYNDLRPAWAPDPTARDRQTLNAALEYSSLYPGQSTLLSVARPAPGPQPVVVDITAFGNTEALVDPLTLRRQLIIPPNEMTGTVEVHAAPDASFGYHSVAFKLSAVGNFYINNFAPILEIDNPAPILIATREDLAMIGTAPEYPLDGNYLLARDLDLSGFTNWEPIGSDTDRFSGTFNGGGNTIRGLSAQSFSHDDIGLFGVIAETGTVHNLRLENPRLSGDVRVGALAGANYGSVFTVVVEGTRPISGRGDVGGLIGFLGRNGSVVSSYADIPVVGLTDLAFVANFRAGGLIGSNAGTIEATLARGSVTQIGSRQADGVGGLVGTLETSGRIRYSYTSGELLEAPLVIARPRVLMSAGGIVSNYNPNQIEATYQTTRPALPGYVAPADLRMQTTFENNFAEWDASNCPRRSTSRVWNLGNAFEPPTISCFEQVRPEFGFANDATVIESETATFRIVLTNGVVPVTDFPLVVEVNYESASRADLAEAPAETIVVRAGRTSAAYSVKTAPDDLNEGPETLRLTLHPATTATMNTAQLTILNVDFTTVAEVGFAPGSDVTVAEGEEVTLSLQLADSVLATRTVRATLEFSDDRPAQTVEIGIGDNSATLKLTAPDDRVHAPPDPLVVTLTAVQDGMLAADRSVATITITDDDPLASVGFAGPFEITVAEGAPVSFRLELANSVVATRAITVRLSGSTQDLTIAPGDNFQGFALQMAPDDNIYGVTPPPLTLTLTSPMNAVLTDGATQVRFTFTDNDPRPPMAGDVASVGFAAGSDRTVAEGANVTLSVELADSVIATRAVSVMVGFSDTRPAVPVMIESGRSSAEFTFTAPNDDAVGQTPPPLTLTLTSPMNGVLTDGATQAMISVTDDDTTPPVTGDGVSVGFTAASRMQQVTEGETFTLRVEVTADAPTTDDVSVTINWHAAGTSTVTIEAGYDALFCELMAPDDSDHGVTPPPWVITLSDPVNAVLTAGAQTATITFLDNDASTNPPPGGGFTPPPTGNGNGNNGGNRGGGGNGGGSPAPLTLTIMPDSMEVQEGGRVTYTITRGNGASEPVRLQVRVIPLSPNAELRDLSTTSVIELPAGSPSVQHTIAARLDSNDESNERFRVEFSPVDATGMSLGTPQRLDLVVRNLAPFRLEAPVPLLAEGAATRIRVTRPESTDLNRPFTLKIQARHSDSGAEATDDLTFPPSVSIPAGETYGEFQLVALSDMIEEPDEQFELTVIGGGTITLTVTDELQLPGAGGVQLAWWHVVALAAAGAFAVAVALLILGRRGRYFVQRR